jgi:GntR family transcriptional regulator/MocR family aminotransferase
MDPLFEIELDHPSKGSRGSSRTIYLQLKAAIVDGRLASGSQLPPTRRSNDLFGVSRNTVTEAYERLRNEGYVVARHGSGTYVAESLPTKRIRLSRKKADQHAHRFNDFWLRPDVTSAIGFWKEEQDSPPAIPNSRQIDFRPALVDSRLFPFDDLRRVIVKQLRRLETRPPRFKSPQGNQGNRNLREAITGHIALTRAVACGPDDVVVTSGAQQAFDLLARTLVVPGQTVVAVEDPGYPPMRVPFAAAGAKIVPVDVDEEGLVVDRLPANVGVICVCPSHQFPLGVTMSKRRRKALIKFARGCGAVIIEDDYDGEFRYEGAPLGALRDSGSADLVFYVGTFSKCMLPSLRLGYVVVPDWAMRPLIAAKNSADWHCSIPGQMGVAGFIGDGHLARHVRRLRQIYGRRRRFLLTSLKETFGEWLDPLPSFYGMHVAATTRSSLNPDRVADTLWTRHVKIHTLSRFYLGPQNKAGFVFGYGAVDLPEMKAGLSLLREALQDGASAQ